MNNECWCTQFCLNGELQDEVACFETEEEAYKYCKEQVYQEKEILDKWSRDLGCSLTNDTIVFDPNNRVIEAHLSQNHFKYWYFEYNTKEELKNLGIDI